MGNITDNIRKNLKEKKQMESNPEETTKNKFNEATNILLNQFIQNINSGRVELNSVGDFTRVVSIAGEINEWSSSNGAGGAPPEITQNQSKLLDDTFQAEVETVDGEDQELVDLHQVANLPKEQMDKLLLDREVAYNKDNEKTF